MRCRSAVRAAGWLACAVLVAAGTALWYINAGAAADGVLAAVQASPPQLLSDRAAVEGAAVAALDGLRLGGLVALATLSGLAVVVGAAADVARSPDGSPAAHAARVAAAAASTALAWFLALAAAALLAAFAALLIISLGVGALPTGGLEAAAAGGVKSVVGLIEGFADDARAALASAPPEVTATDWHKGAVRQLDATFEQLRRVGASDAPDAACPRGCIPLQPEGGGAKPDCLCVAETLERVRGAARRAASALVPAVIGLSLALVGATWLLARGAAALALAKRDARGGGGKGVWREPQMPGSVAAFGPPRGAPPPPPPPGGQPYAPWAAALPAQPPPPHAPVPPQQQRPPPPPQQQQHYDPWRRGDAGRRPAGPAASIQAAPLSPLASV
ncbi:hypothetical protein Rsub_01582 [Raphidocelis subcapitata]|uniref:Uncharacterized protein n=1 Tax=Raphidocelis subcapitata TaxID=307507 RepID=A0A2V0NT15_9CHLO|nr:hypothetical protein Rsub_01582 [Raphidocelis subcapitata]|eukprot:GBF88683.1 hypothetical protein Rsub_01582 [Raphidocelis subcapitata]